MTPRKLKPPRNFRRKKRFPRCCYTCRLLAFHAKSRWTEAGIWQCARAPEDVMFDMADDPTRPFWHVCDGWTAQ